jgi:cell wall-associated NlpC family hydrolase
VMQDLKGCALLALATVMLGCGSLVSAPRYTSAPGAGGAGLSQELQTRSRALRTGNSSRLMHVVRSYLGVPYKWGGTTRDGMDCSALTRAVYREVYGVELPRTSRQMFGLGKSVPPAGKLRAGDLVFFRIDTSGPGVSHVGIYVGDGQFAHASSSRGGVIDPLSNPYFDKRYVGARRVLP